LQLFKISKKSKNNFKINLVGKKKPLHLHSQSKTGRFSGEKNKGFRK
jgi:hypothetical protein